MNSFPSVLVVDDDEDTCRNLADIFGDLGYRVEIAHSGESALELARKHRYDVAVLDLMMPGMDGATLSGEMVKMRVGTVTMIVTAYPANPRAEFAMRGGAWRILSKPVDLRLLLGFIDEVTHQPLLLIVDDDRGLCANLWDLLQDVGYRVCVAHDVISATKRVNDTSYNVILLDIKLPDGDGRQVLAALPQDSNDTQVVVITGCPGGMEQYVQQILSRGINTLMRKPLDVPQLLTVLRTLTSGDAAMGALKSTSTNPLEEWQRPRDN